VVVREPVEGINPASRGRDGGLYRTATILEATTLYLTLVDGPPTLVFALCGGPHAPTLALVTGTRTDRAPYVLVGAYLLVVSSIS